MNEIDKPSTPVPQPRRQALLIVAGLLLTLGAAAGIASLALSQTPAEKAPQAEMTPTRMVVAIATATPADRVRIERQIVAIAPTLPSPTPSPTPTGTPVTPIPWAEAEKNALSWLCYHEVRGMAEARIDACWSVISTVRARYAYGGFGDSDVISVLTREGQFNFEFDLAQPAPDPELYWAVEQYQLGARGSCNGFLYFDSVAGGPVLCVIRASNGQFLEFHNGW